MYSAGQASFNIDTELHSVNKQFQRRLDMEEWGEK